MKRNSRFSKKAQKRSTLILSAKRKKRTGANLLEYWKKRATLDSTLEDIPSSSTNVIPNTSSSLEDISAASINVIANKSYTLEEIPSTSTNVICNSFSTMEDIPSTSTNVIPNKFLNVNETSDETIQCSVSASQDNVHVINETEMLDCQSEIINESVVCEPHSITLEGRRIVKISSMIDQIKEMDDHKTPFLCGFKDMVVLKERRYGLKSFIDMQCQMCKTRRTLCTDPQINSTMDVNMSAVSGTVSTGGGHAQLEETISTMDIPCMTYKTFRKYHDLIADGWKKTAEEEMAAAAKEEAEEAIKRGDIDVDGVPILKVVADGAWAKRSYRNNYSSLSGEAAIVGYHKRKVLYMGVKNKYCTLCSRAEKIGEEAGSHACYKNWGTSQSSTSMEAAIIAEGFKSSEAMYGVRYGYLIADGDSSVYKRLCDIRPYKNLPIKKIECQNHLLRNYCNKIRELVQTSEKGRYPVVLRKFVGKNLTRLRYAVTKAVYYRKTEDHRDKIILLKEDIFNAPHHVFGDHARCASYFCDGTDKRNFKNLVPDLEECGLFQKIKDANRLLSNNSSSLLEDVDSNYAEHFNHAVAKFVGGKRINFTGRRSYEARCQGAVVQHNTGMAQYKLHKSMFGTSPGVFTKTCQVKRKMKINLDKQSRNKRPKIRRCLFTERGQKLKTDQDYGPNAQAPDMPEMELEKEKQKFLASLRLSNEKREELERKTRQQSESPEWLEERRKRVTASNFGRICKRRPTTSCQNLVRDLLYGMVRSTQAMMYGHFHEELAIKAVEHMTGKKIQKCGLFFDSEYQYISATPDGLVTDGKGIVEIKCPQRIENIHPRQAAEDGILEFLKVRDNHIEINRKHNYHYQVQGQIRVTGREYCLFCIWSSKGVEILEIRRDDNFWKEEMEPYLTTFYTDCILPELVDPRHPRSMPIRDPEWIKRAQAKSTTMKHTKVKMLKDT